MAPGLTALIVAMGAVINAVMMYYYIHAWIPPTSLIIQFTRAIVLAWVVMWVYVGLRAVAVWLGRLWIVIVMILLSMNCMIDLFVYNIYHIHFTHDFLVAMVDANRTEAADFLTTYLDFRFCMLLIGFSILFLAVYLAFDRLGPWLRRQLDSRPKTWGVAVGALLVASVAVNVNGADVMGAKTDIVAKIESASRYRPAQEITAILPAFTITDMKDAPAEIIVIVGESHSKDHSQLYGYEKPTEPRLMKMAADSAIIVFENAYTSACYTVGTFKEIIGTWSHTLPDDSAWYRCPTFIQIAKAAGFHTAWISNQNRYGLGDSPIASMAALADTMMWTDNGLRTMYNYDEALIPILRKEQDGGDCRRVSLIHLAGSHMMPEDRFPADRRVFAPSDYPSSTVGDLRIIADYDNSVLYNDSVLSEIFKLYADKDALVIYFSDHGEDLYQSSDGYFGHGTPRGSRSYKITERIPFMVFCGKPFKAGHPELYHRIVGSARDSVNTTNLTYTIMDILGMELDGHPEARSRSFFKR